MAELDELYCSSKLAALNHSKTEGLGERSADPSLKESIHQGRGRYKFHKLIEPQLPNIMSSSLGPKDQF
jgi:hypothetical protein